MIRILDYIFYRTYLEYKRANELEMQSSILYLSFLLMFSFLPVIGFFCEIMRNGSGTFYKILLLLNFIFIYIAVSVRYMKKGMIRELRDEFSDCKWNDEVPMWTIWSLIFISMIVGTTLHFIIVKTIIDPYGLTGIGYNFLVNFFGN